MIRRFILCFLVFSTPGILLGGDFGKILNQKNDGDKMTVAIDGQGKMAILTVEIATSSPAKEIGLMNRTALTDIDGMLFVYSKPVYTGFWMKNTLIPLDMIFINDKGVVVFIHKNAKPHDLTSIKSPMPVLAVIEIKGGMADSYGIAVGNRVSTPKELAKRRRWSILSR